MEKEIHAILKIFHDNGLFHEGVELIGSWCFKLYQKHLGMAPYPLRTQDIDFLVPYPYPGKKDRAQFIDQLKALGFNVDFNSDGAMYLWNAELKIEFIVPEKGRGGTKATTIKSLGIHALPLRFVSLLLEDPITIDEAGLKIKVPNPINFCLHKLVIAARRRDLGKRINDIRQAILTAQAVDQKALKKKYDSLPIKWRKAILAMLNNLDEETIMIIPDAEAMKFTLQ